jgi:hypothetical protein
MSETAAIQGSDMSIGRILIMAVSHTGVHVGQIQYVTKMLLRDAYRESTNQGKTR